MIGVMSNPARTWNLGTREGVVGYISCAVIPDVQRAVQLHGHLRPFGIVFATVTSGGAAPRPTPLLIGHPGMDGSAIKQAMQRAVVRTHAVGCAWVRQDCFTLRAGMQPTLVVLQVEHRAFPDLEWHANLASRKLAPFAGPYELAASEVTLSKTAFLPQRWMQ